MDDRNSRIASALERLFRTYPQSDRGEATDVVRERIERAKVYFEAVEPYELRDVEAAVQSFITGSAPGVNHAFVPAAPMVASETRRLMNLRLDREAREKARRPALPPPDVERPPEARARVKALIEETVANLSAASLSPRVESEQNRLAMLRRANQRFDAERGFEAGDRQGDRDVA